MSIRNGLLALLADGPEYGFALKKQFEERTAELWPLNVGQVYTTLGRLVRDGLVDEVAATGDSKSESGGDAGQREYRLTERGRDELAEWIRSPRPRDVPDRDELVIKIVLAEGLDGVDLLDIVDEQRAVSTEALQRLTRQKAAIDPTDIGRVLALDAVILQVEAELRWLDLCEARVLAAGRSGPEGSGGVSVRGRRR
ncbi:MAG: PadR family transcriptional regulator [Actinomycetota bacterium]|nr:PadR family transcriptional regulator [Actinomycetota bacterium]